jgi:hypothetical protein
MNQTRGLFRWWAILSVVWIVFAAWTWWPDLSASCRDTGRRQADPIFDEMCTLDEMPLKGGLIGIDWKIKLGAVERVLGPPVALLLIGLAWRRFAPRFERPSST